MLDKKMLEEAVEKMEFIKKFIEIQAKYANQTKCKEKCSCEDEEEDTESTEAEQMLMSSYKWDMGDDYMNLNSISKMKKRLKERHPELPVFETSGSTVYVAELSILITGYCCYYYALRDNKK